MSAAEHDPTGPTHATPAPAPQVAPPVPEVEAPAPQSPAPVPIGSLRVGHAEDRAESEADEMADRALARLPRVGPETHQHGPGCDHVRRTPTATGALVGHEGGDLDQATSTEIETRRGGGRPMDEPVLRRMESAFGQSLAGVRIHDDPASARLNRAVSARAFTTGRDVFFGAGEYSPDTVQGERVLAHELAHTLQNATGAHRLVDPASIQAAAGARIPVAQDVVGGDPLAPFPIRRRESGSDRDETQAEEEEYEDLSTDHVDWDADFDESAAADAEYAKHAPEQATDQEEEDCDDLSTDHVDWDADFDESAAADAEYAKESAERANDREGDLDDGADEDAGEREADFEADLAELDAVALDERVPEPQAGAPSAQVTLHHQLDQVTAAHQELSPDPGSAELAATAYAMSIPGDEMLVALNDLITEGFIRDEMVGELMTSLAYGCLDQAAAERQAADAAANTGGHGDAGPAEGPAEGAAEGAADGALCSHEWYAELTTTDVDRILRSAILLTLNVATLLPPTRH